MIEGIILSIISFLAFLLVHVIVFQITTPHHRWKVVTFVAFIFLVLYTITFYALPFPEYLEVTKPGSVLAQHAGYGNGALIYIFLFFSYAQFYFLIDRGVSARILVDIINSENRRLTRDEIITSYSPRVLQDRRLTDMLYGGYIKEDGGVYSLTKKGIRNAHVFNWAKRLLKLYPGG